MRAKTLLIYLFAVIILASGISFVSSITGSLGNSVMVLRMAPEDTIQKSILVKNINSEDLRIELFVTGELNESIVLSKTNFSLAAGDEKKVYFKITSPEETGTKEARINVKFIPEEGSSVGLASKVVLNTGNYENPTESDDTKVDYNNPNEFEESKSIFNFGSDKEEEKESSSTGEEGTGFPVIYLLLISPIVLLIVLIILVVFAARKKEGSKVTKRSLKHE